MLSKYEDSLKRIKLTVPKLEKEKKILRVTLNDLIIDIIQIYATYKQQTQLTQFTSPTLTREESKRNNGPTYVLFACLQLYLMSTSNYYTIHCNIYIILLLFCICNLYCIMCTYA